MVPNFGAKTEVVVGVDAPGEAVGSCACA